MQIRSIQSTPNPNSMKLNLDLDRDLQFNQAVTYSRADREGCPSFVGQLLDLEGLQSVFLCQDFITLNKDPRSEWQPILEQSAAIISGRTDTNGISGENHRREELRKAAQHEGEVQLLVQTFKGVPIQIKAVDAAGESRISLGEIFNQTAQTIQEITGANYLTERHWADHGRRYGERQEMADQLKEELLGRYDEQALEHLKQRALGATEATALSAETLRQYLTDEDWRKRLTAVQELSAENDRLPLLQKALSDEHPQVRRLAAAALGATGDAAAVPALSEALLKDPSVAVRRTAGDALSDLGEVKAQTAVCQALKDENKLVRWRAARFLFENGTEEAVESLEQAAGDPAFEVRLEIDSALERIKGGEKGQAPAWKRIVESPDF
ncbi:MAG TPA: virulence factor [Chroococcales cyanobacterium]